MAKKSNAIAKKALADYRAKVKSGEIDVAEQKAKHIEVLTEKLKKAEERVAHLKQLLIRAKSGGIKTSVKKDLDNLDAEEMLKVQEYIKSIKQ